MYRLTDSVVYFSRSRCNSAHSSFSLSDSSELAVGAVRLRNWLAAWPLACPSHRLTLVLRACPPLSSPSCCSWSLRKLGAWWIVPSDSLLLPVFSDWQAVRGGGEWAVGVACQRWRGCWGVASEGVTWKRPTVKAGVFFFPTGKNERV